MKKNQLRKAKNYNLKSVSTDAWFSPQQPINPVAQEQATGRQFAFPVGSNLQYTPRQNEPVTFAQLRGLADNLDILRAVIETRKDQMIILDYEFLNKNGEIDKRCEDLREFFRYPDKENDWATWLRMLLEDLFVIDAPTLYINKTRGGDIYGLEIMDGSAIKVLIDDKGRSPVPPDASYQAVFYGVPAVDYTKNEIIYRPRNKRSNKLYGYSQVEQVLMTVNIALRRQVAQLQYYTEGNIPSAIMSTPENWTLENIKLFQQYWDSILEGNTAKRRHAIFTPHGVTLNPTHENPLNDKFDEWLARIISFVFSISPQAFVAQVNRATADTAKQTADEEGIAPIKLYIKNLIDFIINQHFGYKDIEFKWKVEADINQETQAKIDDMNIKNGSKTINEIRLQRGDEPLDEQVEQTDESKVIGEKTQKLKKSDGFTDELSSQLYTIGEGIVSQIPDDYQDKKSDEVINAIDMGGFSLLMPTIELYIQRQFEEINTAEMDTLGELSSKAKEYAIEYAKARSGEMIQGLQDSTRSFIRSDIATAIEADLPISDLKTLLQSNYAFSEARAQTIARTELAMAVSAGKQKAWDLSDNVIGKRYVMSDKHPKSDICDQASAMGIVAKDSDFGGIGNAPAHPNCLCKVIPVLKG